MSVTLTPDQEAAVEQAVREGRYATPAEALEAALSALKAPVNPVLVARPRLDAIRSKNLADLLSEYPWAGADIQIERDQTPLRDLDL